MIFIVKVLFFVEPIFFENLLTEKLKLKILFRVCVCVCEVLPCEVLFSFVIDLKMLFT